MRWSDLIAALEDAEFIIKPNKHGAICAHPDHPRKGFVTLGNGHKPGSSQPVKRGYIRDLVDYLEELWLAKGGNTDA